ncbi:MAG: DUF2721 domain-containing protein [Opitutales bacterium]|nr:DUF2721 domain-containing protein [Opitutales bacterium]
MNFEELSTTLQLATSPAILVSACGLLLLSMTNRLGRAIDRSRGGCPIVPKGTRPVDERPPRIRTPFPPLELGETLALPGNTRTPPGGRRSR